MPIALRMEVNIASTIRQVNGMAGRLGDLTPVNNRLGLRIARDARARLNKRPQLWFGHTGTLAKSVNHVAGPDFVEVGTNLKYAAIQQVGGVVVPKTGRFLALPATRKIARSGSWPRDFPPGALAFVRVVPITIAGRSWHGPALVTASAMKRASASAKKVKGREAKQTARDAILSGAIQFALIKRATIPGRPYLVLEAPTREWYERQIEKFATSGQ